MNNPFASEGWVPKTLKTKSQKATSPLMAITPQTGYINTPTDPTPKKNSVEQVSKIDSKADAKLFFKKYGITLGVILGTLIVVLVIGLVLMLSKSYQKKKQNSNSEAIPYDPTPSTLKLNPREELPPSTPQPKKSMSMEKPVQKVLDTKSNHSSIIEHESKTEIEEKPRQSIPKEEVPQPLGPTSIPRRAKTSPIQITPIFVSDPPMKQPNIEPPQVKIEPEVGTSVVLEASLGSHQMNEVLPQTNPEDVQSTVAILGETQQIVTNSEPEVVLVSDSQGEQKIEQ